MKGLVIGLLVGAALGGAAAFYFFVGVSRSPKPPGFPILPPDAAGSPSGTAQIVLKQEFFNEVLNTIFRDMNAPAFPLSEGGSTACPNRITLLNEGSGVQTRLNFANNKIAAPLAFSGSYSSMFGCFQFTGWTQSSLDLRFDVERQAVLGQVTADTVSLDGVDPFFNALLTPIVQSTLNERVNPILILDGRQLAINLPIQATGGTLQGKVTDVRGEVKHDALSLFVTYEFVGQDAPPGLTP